MLFPRSRDVAHHQIRDFRLRHRNCLKVSIRVGGCEAANRGACVVKRQRMRVRRHRGIEGHRTGMGHTHKTLRACMETLCWVEQATILLRRATSPPHWSLDILELRRARRGAGIFTRRPRRPWSDWWEGWSRW